MQEVYGGSFRLGDRAPLLQMAVNALASGDRRRAADLASEVSFPPPEYASRFRNAGLRCLNWGPAHRRGNPTIDVEAWLKRKAWERKYDPNQLRVPRGHPDGGQWTDDPGTRGDDDYPAEELLTDEEQQEVGRLAERARRILADGGDPNALVVLAAGGEKPPKLPRSKWGALAFFAEFLGRMMVQRAFEGRNSPVWFDVVDWFAAINNLMPEFESYLTPPKEWEELVADRDYHTFDSYDDFQGVYGSAGAFHDWHHLVEQESGFSQREINNTENIIRVPRGRHWQITSFMTKSRDCLGGLSWRQWLRGKSIEEHRRVGMMAARYAGVLK